MSELQLAWAAGSDPGRRRANNQDSAAAEETLFVVADGMGGAAAGEVASRVAVEAMRATITEGGGTLVDAVHLANRAIYDQAVDDASLRGMGTTLAALALVEDADGTTRVHVVNVGDSRVYLLRDGELAQITDDHSLVAELEREGRITAEEARVHPQRNIVTRVLGNAPDVDVDEFAIDPYRGDRFVLCSDGLFNEVSDADIAAVLRHESDPQRAVDDLVQRANAAGGRDNITVVVVDVVADGDKAGHASAALAGAAAGAAPAAPLVTAAVEAPSNRSGHAEPVGDGEAVTRSRRARRFTWRSALFSLALLVVLGAVVGSVWWFARGTYYVGFDRENVAIFKGRPGGVLWFEPTVEQTYDDITKDDVQAARLADLEEGRTQPDLAEARAYVRQVTTTTTSTTTTSTTTTSTTSTTTPAFPPPA
jgi:serine/threonine protein phosphatase PrpC